MTNQLNENESRAIKCKNDSTLLCTLCLKNTSNIDPLTRVDFPYFNDSTLELIFYEIIKNNCFFLFEMKFVVEQKNDEVFHFENLF